MTKHIPYTSLAEGISHGPYTAAPGTLIEHYHQTARPHDQRSDEQRTADIQSEWQYDQHSAAVDEATEAGRITPDHAAFMLEYVLRPWFIGSRR